MMRLYVIVFLSTIVQSNCHVHKIPGAFVATGALNKLASVVTGGLTSGFNFGFGVNVNHGVEPTQQTGNYYESNEPNGYAPNFYNGPPPHHQPGYGHHYGHGPPVNRFPPQPNNPYGHNMPVYNQGQIQHGYGRPQEGHYGGGNYGSPDENVNSNQEVQTPNLPAEQPTQPNGNQYQQNNHNYHYKPHDHGYGRPQHGGNSQQNQEQQVPNPHQTYPTRPNSNNQHDPNGQPQFINNNDQQNINQPDRIETPKPSTVTTVTPVPKPIDEVPNPVPSLQTTKKPDDDDTPFVPLNPNKPKDGVNAPKQDDDDEEIFDLDIRIKD